jgi:hypothetical protein
VQVGALPKGMPCEVALRAGTRGGFLFCALVQARSRVKGRERARYMPASGLSASVLGDDPSCLRGVQAGPSSRPLTSGPLCPLSVPTWLRSAPLVAGQEQRQHAEAVDANTVTDSSAARRR